MLLIKTWQIYKIFHYKEKKQIDKPLTIEPKRNNDTNGKVNNTNSLLKI